MRSEGRGGIDKAFLFLVFGMMIFGLVMLASASSPLGYERFGDSYYFLKRQVLSGVLPGLLGLMVLSQIPYQLYRRYAFPLLLLSISLLVLVFIPGVGADFGTFAKSWVSIGGFAFQPSEIVKITFLLYLAAWMEKGGSSVKDFHEGFVPFMVVLGVISALMLLQPDTGSLSIICAMAFIVYFVAGAPLKYLFGIGATGVAVLALLIQTSEYRATRFKTFLHPELDPQGVGYQINQALLAIGGGGPFGRGYGHSLQKFQYLPEVAGDSIFAVVGEELGFIFTAVFLIAYLSLLLRGFYIAERVKDDFGKYIVVGVIGWFGVQALVNIGSMVGIMPMTGVPLPFLSHGGTALAVSLWAVGIVLSVSREMKTR